MNRRQFLHTGSMIGLGTCLLPNLRQAAAASTPGQARVVSAAAGVDPRQPDLKVLGSALDRGLEALFGRPAPRVWASLFSPRDVVGLKVNCLAGRGISTSPILVELVVDRLRTAGVNPGQIIIWDRLNADLKRGGFPIITEAGRVRCFGNDVAGYSRRLFESGSVCSRLSNLVAETCTALINLPVLKDHGIVGLSAAMKNWFGAIDNPNKYHDHCGDPFVAETCSLPLLRDKIRLTICDAITAQYEGGPPCMPQWCWPLQRLILATDMVALDTVAWQIIEDKRRQAGMASLREAGREPAYIRTAAGLGLGIADPVRIEIVKV